MNKTTVNPLLNLSHDGPTVVTGKYEELIHLRQGDADGACALYCFFMALIGLGFLRREKAINMVWDGRTAEGRFHSHLKKYSPLINQGLSDNELLELTGFFQIERA